MVPNKMSCTLRKFHIPKPPSSDHHHVIPQAWQRSYAQGTTLGLLWDRRTVECCPNCHRKIHEAIVQMMRSGHSEDPLDAKVSAFGKKRLTREQTVAYAALIRFREAGGSLVALRTHKLFGEQ